MLLCGGASAQTYLWQEDFSSYKAGDVPSGGDYSYVCTGSSTKVFDEKLAGGTAPELLVTKSNGKFAATIKLNGATGSATLAYKKNNKTLTVSATNASVGTITVSGNDCTCPITFDENATEITITFAAGSSNVRLDNIKLYQGEAKKPAGLSWGTAARTVTIGSNDNVFPTLANANNLTVTYTSSDTDVATITEDGTITLVAAGKTDITASFAGDDTYEAGSVTYALTVKAASTKDISNTPETAYTVAEAKKLIAAGEGLDKQVYVGGKISSVKEVSTEYGNATYNISDDGTTASDQLVVYHGYYLNGEKFTSEDQIKVGDVVIVYGKLTSYNNTDEVNSGNQIYSLYRDPSSISSLSADEAVADAPAYNLAGQKVTGAYKGVVVKGGKKFVQK